MRTLRLLNLHCNETNNENNNTVKLNKTFLTVDNGSFHILGPESMINGDDWKVNADVQFNKQAKISFFDEDLIRNLSTTKHFKNYIIEEDDIHDIPKKFSFATGNANYILTYEII